LLALAQFDLSYPFAAHQPEDELAYGTACHRPSTAEVERWPAGRLEPRRPSPCEARKWSSARPEDVLVGWREAPWPPGGLSTAQVLMVDEELDAIELRIQASQEGGWPRAHSLNEVVPSQSTLDPLLQAFGPGAERGPFREHAGHSVRTVLAQYQVGSQVGTAPAFAKSRGIRAELYQQVAKGLALTLAERGHAVILR
jgi:hypothetical protein